MIEIISNKEENKSIINMSEMKPLQVGIIVNGSSYGYNGHYVMRTASTNQFEVINLSDPGYDSCWTKDIKSVVNIDLKVRLLTEPLILKITN